MIERGQVWTSGGRSVRVLSKDNARVVVRDTYGWRRRLTVHELEHGFRLAGRAERVRGVMARRALADIDAA